MSQKNIQSLAKALRARLEKARGPQPAGRWMVDEDPVLPMAEKALGYFGSHCREDSDSSCCHSGNNFIARCLEARRRSHARTLLERAATALDAAEACHAAVEEAVAAANAATRRNRFEEMCREAVRKTDQKYVTALARFHAAADYPYEEEEPQEPAAFLVMDEEPAHQPVPLVANLPADQTEADMEDMEEAVSALHLLQDDSRAPLVAGNPPADRAAEEVLDEDEEGAVTALRLLGHDDSHRTTQPAAQPMLSQPAKATGGKRARKARKRDLQRQAGRPAGRKSPTNLYGPGPAAVVNLAADETPVEELEESSSEPSSQGPAVVQEPADTESLGPAVALEPVNTTEGDHEEQDSDSGRAALRLLHIINCDPVELATAKAMGGTSGRTAVESYGCGGRSRTKPTFGQAGPLGTPIRA